MNHNPYEPPQSQLQNERIFKTPIIVPLSVIAVIGIYLGYIYFHQRSVETGIFEIIKNYSFEIFLLCQAGFLFSLFYSKIKLEGFLSKHPVISTGASLELLKPILRTNMYLALINMFFMFLGSLAAIMTIANHSLMKVITVSVLFIFTNRMMKLYKPVEEKTKQIKCTDRTLNSELESILNCWLHKAKPNF